MLVAPPRGPLLRALQELPVGAGERYARATKANLRGGNVTDEAHDIERDVQQAGDAGFDALSERCRELEQRVAELERNRSTLFGVDELERLESWFEGLALRGFTEPMTAEVVAEVERRRAT